MVNVGAVRYGGLPHVAMLAGFRNLGTHTCEQRPNKDKAVLQVNTSEYVCTRTGGIEIAQILAEGVAPAQSCDIPMRFDNA
jgi:hypothetical protein